MNTIPLISFLKFMGLSSSLFVFSVLVVGCGEDTPECEQYETREACFDAGCSPLPAIKVDFDEGGQCTLDEMKDPEMICVYRERSTGEQVETMYFRDSEPQTDIRWFWSDHGPIEGWTRCKEAGRGQLCGCMYAALVEE